MLLPFYNEHGIECGLDEAGRGALAGPVVAAAVILPKNFTHLTLNDSKQLSVKKREELKVIIEQEALAWAIGTASCEEIDQYNILNASILAMHRAVDQLSIQPDRLLVDGNRFKPYMGIGHVCLIKGDARFLAIAAASILAKTHRDALMNELAEQFPVYQWEQNMAYPTKSHRQAIEKFGVTPQHRLSFTLLKKDPNAQ